MISRSFNLFIKFAQPLLLVVAINRDHSKKTGAGF